MDLGGGSGGGCLCFGCLSGSRSECLSVAGADVDAVVLLSAPLCVLAHDKSTLVPTELGEIKLGYGMGLFPAPLK